MSYGLFLENFGSAAGEASCGLQVRRLKAYESNSHADGVAEMVPDSDRMMDERE